MAKEKENAAPRSLGATQRKRSRESAAVAELPYFRHTMKPRALLVATLVALACVSSVRSQSAGGSSPERQQQQQQYVQRAPQLEVSASLPPRWQDNEVQQQQDQRTFSVILAF